MSEVTNKIKDSKKQELSPMEVQVNMITNKTPECDRKKQQKVSKSESEKVLKKDKKKTSNRNRNQNRISPRDVTNNLKCFAVFGLRGIGLLLLILLVAVLHFVTFILFSFSQANLFDKAGRPGVWVFPVLSCGFVFLCIFFLISWKKSAVRYIKKYHGTASLRSTENNQTIFSMYSVLCGLDGKYYLLRLFTFEFLEQWIQYINLSTIYLCGLTIQWSTLICVVLFIESSYRAWKMGRRLLSKGPVTVKERDNQVISDSVIDFFFLVFPLAMLFLVYKIRLNVFHCLMIVLSSTISLFAKLRRILMSTFFFNIDQMFIVEQEKVSIRLSRRRYSIFAQNRNEKIQKIQNKYFPKWMRITAFTLSFVYSLLLFVTIIIHLSTFNQASEECEKSLGVDSQMIWENGCKVKTPFCKKMFQAQCDCAVLEVKNHNMTKLPPKIIEMKSLQRLVIKNGPLKELPPKMNELNEEILEEKKYLYIC